MRCLGEVFRAGGPGTEPFQLRARCPSLRLPFIEQRKMTVDFQP